MNKKITVLIPDGENNHAMVVARCLNEKPNVELIVASKSGRAGLRFSRKVSQFFKIKKSLNEKEYYKKINEIIKKTKVNIILPIGEEAAKYFQIYKEKLDISVKLALAPPNRIIDAATNKLSLFKILSKQKIPSPHTIDVYKDMNRNKEKLKPVKFPVLVKPCVGEGGKGIKKFVNYEELEKYLKQNKNLRKEILIQEFIHGFDIDCSVLCCEGKILAYTIQKGFKERPKYGAAAGIMFLENDEVLGIVKAFTQKTQWNGIAHIDLRYDEIKRQYRLIEVNARYWGSLTGSLLVGVNFPYLACLAGLGIEFDIPHYRNERFIEHSLAVRQIIKKVLGQNYLQFKMKETDLKYFIKDPVGEILNKYNRWKYNP